MKIQPKHTVIIITYNQQELISRALESLVCQEEYLYEIVVSDDCSTDKTWEVILEYQRKYPGLIKPYRNSVNLGIFGNIESTWTKPSGDIIWYLSGDDEYCNGIFAEANYVIEKRQIKYLDDAITIYFDYKTIDPLGKEFVVRNNLIEQHNPISLKIRQLICNRTIGISRKVLDRYYPVRKDLGITADGLQDIQAQFFSVKNYYAPFVGSVYYTNIGISTVIYGKRWVESFLLTVEQLKFDINNIEKKDEQWLNYLQRQSLFRISPSLVTLSEYILYFILNIEFKYGWFFIKRELKNILKDTIKFTFVKSKL
jgi:glycosyltransferase involved in cell wall biosynthesis